jgi:hypothetical protein
MPAIEGQAMHGIDTGERPIFADNLCIRSFHDSILLMG